MTEKGRKGPNAGKKKCPHCKRLFPRAEIQAHIREEFLLKQRQEEEKTAAEAAVPEAEYVATNPVPQFQPHSEVLELEKKVEILKQVVRTLTSQLVTLTNLID